MTDLLKLNLGACDDRRPGFLSVDRCQPADIIADLSVTWPWADSSVDELFCKDVLEHLENENFRGNRGKIWSFNEAWRVLKPGGRLEFLVPCVHLSDGRVNPGAFADPTHVAFFTMDDRYYYVDKWADPRTGERGRLGPSYGITCMFREITWELQEYGAAHERRSKIHAIWEAVK